MREPMIAGGEASPRDGARRNVRQTWFGVGLLSLVVAACAGSGPAPTPTPRATESPWSPKCATTPREVPGEPASALTIVAELGAAGCGFDTTALVALAAPRITIEFVDRDSALPHNFAVYRDASRDELIGATKYHVAVQRETLELVGLEPGVYVFFCDSHTGSMFGSLTVITSASTDPPS